MSMVKINPKMYGTCRLCLEDMGQYMIVPKVQEQIKYCFDIVVEPFDGLPQLLCNSCEGTLRDFFEIKKTYILKQNDLLNKVKDKNKRNCGDKEELNVGLVNKLDNSLTSRRKEETLSTIINSISAPSESTIDESESVSTNNVLWPLGYRKIYACRLCSYTVDDIYNMKKHIRTQHKQLEIKYHDVFQKNCEVKLDKCDKKPNITGFHNTVVFSNDKIMQNVGKEYLIIYIPKGSLKNKYKNNKEDADEKCTARKRKKKSLSSNEQSEIERMESSQSPIRAKKSTKEVISSECICIEDSDSASEETCMPSEGNSDKIVVSRSEEQDFINENVAIIKDIISACHIKNKMNVELTKTKNPISNDESHKKSQLNHKVLSIGRKIINKRAFNCTGLLRYLEHKNLEILWKPNITNSYSDPNFVRIMTKLREYKEDEDETGWKTLSQGSVVLQDDTIAELQLVELPENTQKCETKLLNANPVANPKQLPRKSAVIAKHNETVSNIAPSLSNEVHIMSDIDCLEKSQINLNNKCKAGLSNDIKTKEAEISTARIKVKPLSELLSEKGLNTLMDNKPNRFNHISPSKDQNEMSTCVVPANDSIRTTRLVQNSPIIPVNKLVSTNHTVQLSSNVFLNQITQASIVVQPSILVQPSQIAQPSQTIQPSQIVQASLVVQPSQNYQASQISQPVHDKGKKNIPERTSSEAPSNRTEYVLMDSPDMPNTKTKSPIVYVKNLFQIHNIHLLDNKSDFPNAFVCLIRFKVLYKQDTIEDPILLSLSLLSHKNKFCMHVENLNQENVVLADISANWQWEIIKVFIGDVASKLLQNARKVNEETYENVKTLLCLLKSINYRRQ